ncbi:MAG: hypothetical protein AMJ59_11580 [Gammaproteobacteria bacterium SG8_31]|jgi:5'-nucleotidase (lipoprotein e(P4) family)|nr:MAG: hypothetical protein AMJ59_11580 [Gammaproteobacteria bacterium SG8_31]
MVTRIRALLLSTAVLAGCVLSPPPDERLHSTLWVQTSAEYAVLTRQVYGLAADRLESGLTDPDWNAVPGAPAGWVLPPAIIVDVDDTVLDNSGHSARMILAREGFTTENWRAWVRESSAPAVPGAVDYLRSAVDLGITVFYVTNRHHDLEDDTRRNLVAVGCPVATEVDVVLTRLEDPEWGRDKTSRRDFIAQRYRVLQIVGDDLADFIHLPKNVDDKQRSALAAQQDDRWGQSWFMIPNPMYGSWEQALMPEGVSLFSRPMEEKFEHLEPK